MRILELASSAARAGAGRTRVRVRMQPVSENHRVSLRERRPRWLARPRPRM